MPFVQAETGHQFVLGGRQHVDDGVAEGDHFRVSRSIAFEGSWHRGRLAGSEVSRRRLRVTDMAEYRLPRGARPRRYELELTPDLAAVSVRRRRRWSPSTCVEPGRELVCNAVELQISEARLETPGGADAGRAGDPRRGGPAGHHRLRRAAPARCRLPAAPALHRRAQRPAARLLPQHLRGGRRQRAGDRRHPVRTGGRPAGLPVLGRAGVQGVLRREPGRRRAADGPVERGRRSARSRSTAAAGGCASTRPC